MSAGRRVGLGFPVMRSIAFERDETADRTPVGRKRLSAGGARPVPFSLWMKWRMS
jgi:hypothetical protein